MGTDAMIFVSGMLTVITLSFQSFAAPPKEASAIPCKKEIDSFLQQIDSKNEWTKVLSPGSEMAFRSPTSKIGVWVELQTAKDPTIYQYDLNGIRLHQWRASDCQKIKATSSNPISHFKSASGFSDLDLEKLLKTKKDTLIYIWSPDQIYSMTAMKNFNSIAQKKNMKFISLVDPSVTPKAIEQALKAQDMQERSQPMNSVEFLMLQATNHFPSTFILHKGKISERIIGALSPEQVEDHVAQQLKQMNKSSK